MHNNNNVQNQEYVYYDYYEGRPRNVVMEHHNRVMRQVGLRRHLRNSTDPFTVSVAEFSRLYRMPQHILLELVEIIRPLVQVRTASTYVPLEIKVLCAVSFYAAGSYQRHHGRLADLNLSQATVSIVLAEITSALNHPELLTRFIKFPLSIHEREAIIARNDHLGLPRVLGFIDGTLVKIVPPRKDQEQHVYRSRKGFTALNVQIVCDASLYIMNINARYPGSCGDPYIYRASPVRRIMQDAFNESHCWLLGDSAYPFEPWMQLPLPHAERGTPEYHYTKLHCHSRNCVERCIGVLKARWRCLLADRTLHYNPTKAGHICNACVVLHNFLHGYRLPTPPPVLENLGNDEPEELEEEEVFQTAQEVRRFLIQVAQDRWLRLHEGD